MERDYVHGYTDREETRLVAQATSLSDLLHADTTYPAESTVLEAGCGVGAQTVLLAHNSPEAHFVAVDSVAHSLAIARERVASAGLDNVTFEQADIFRLPYPDHHFDHVFVCFVLEHLRNPVGALRCLKRVIVPGGSLTAIEGDHGSTYFYPDSPAARRTIQCLIDIQAQMGGNSLIGRQLYPLLTGAGYGNVRVSPRMVYVDASRPALVEGFTKNTFIAMVEGVKQEALQRRLIDESTWKKGIADLHRTTQADGTFIYTFFKGIGCVETDAQSAHCSR